MKKLFSTLIVFAIMIIGCGDETLAAELLAGLGETLEECRARKRREKRAQKNAARPNV